MTSGILWISLYLVLALLIPVYLLYQHFHIRTRPSSKTQFNTALECRTIIEGRRLPDHSKNRLTKYEARALENRDLRRAFGIHNAFTTTREAYAKQFVLTASELIRLSREDWDNLGATLYRSVWNMKVTEKDGRVRFNLAPMTQALTLRSSLWVSFRMKYEVDNKLLIDLGEIIHRTWMNVKQGDKLVEFRDNYVLRSRLSAVFANHDINMLSPRSNPLNLIVPGFETLWRLVLRLFIELHRHEDWRAILVAFVRKPTSTQFSRELGDDGISAEFLVKEALRLYPPTRRIRRTFQFSGSEARETFTADVEACQTDPKVWGADALEFKPARWKKKAVVPELSFLAFGGRPFLCPAHHDFGPRAVGLLAGILLDEFGEGWVLESEDAREMGDLRSGERLRNDRDAYGGVFLVLDL
ncbi:hypothetical protein BDW62DRAFT_220604 [Aspergillus aurantiobrunneus]